MFLNNLRSMPGFHFGFEFEFSGVAFYITLFSDTLFNSDIFVTFPGI